MPKVDPITFAVVRNKLISIANGMIETAAHCGVSSFLSTIMDCSFAILDADAGIIAQSEKGILLFLSSSSPATRNCIDYIGRENMEPEDVIISTVPEFTGNHTSDAVLFTPIFFENMLFGYATTKAHWQDVGAKNTYPTDAVNIYEEGLRIPPVKLYKRGVLQTEVLEIIRWNSRAPELVWGDIQAQIAGCHFGEKQVTELLGKYSVETIDACIQEMYDHSERITRLAIDKIPDGTLTAEDFIDSNGIDLDKPIKTKVTVTVKGSDITIDFTGSGPEQRGPMNGLWVTTLSASRMAVKALTSPELPANEGSNRPVTVIAPEGCVYNAGPAAPCFLCGNVASTILELINKALYEVLPERIPACSGGDVCGMGFFGVNPDTGRHWATLSSAAIGNGADFYSDGDNGTAHHSIAGAGGGQGSSIELTEATFPLMIEQYELIRDSGGAGKHRGGLGSALQIKLLSPATLFAFVEKGKAPHWGIDGGKEGLRNYSIIQPENGDEFEVLKTSGMELAAGCRVIAVAGGGGGYGNPIKRDIEDVRRDVINGYVSVESARQDYGVVIDPQSFKVDKAATEELRNSM
ncbi:MAG TPA: hydantoinase B/oxoprolinase family protein [Dehalococcoidia bacterium]|nr:hydantoinase B/oxoprolinase family protein [Dehalococcoidia bacterium]